MGKNITDDQLKALISFLVAKFGPKGDYVDPATARTMSSSVDMNAPMMGSYNVPVDQSSYAPYQNATVNNAPYGQQPLQYQDPLQGTPYADPGMAQQPSPFVPQSSSSPFVPQQQSPYAGQPYDAQSPYAPQPAPFAGQPSSMRRPHLMQRLQQLQLPLQSLPLPSPYSAEAVVCLLRQEAISATIAVHRSIKEFNGNTLHEGFSVE